MFTTPKIIVHVVERGDVKIGFDVTQVITVFARPKGIVYVVEWEDVKVTVQFETEGIGQNESFSHMNRSEVKL